MLLPPLAAAIVACRNDWAPYRREELIKRDTGECELTPLLTLEQCTAGKRSGEIVNTAVVMQEDMRLR